MAARIQQGSVWFGLAIAALVGCGYSEDEMQRVRDDLATRTQELEAERREVEAREARISEISAQNTAMSSRLSALGENVQALETERGQLAADLGQTQRALEELRARERQAQARLQTFRDMLGRFRQMIASGRLDVRVTRGRMVVVLRENILFDSGQAELKSEGQAALAEVAQILAGIADRNFQVEGHTDTVPISSRRFPSNWELSTARAVTVARYLQQQGVPAARLSAAGYAETQPVAPNETSEGRQQNRRIEIVLMPNLDELPSLRELERELTPTPAP